MRLGNNIQYLRRQKQMTQEQLAERMDVSRQTVSRWEANAVTPELDKLVAMCELNRNICACEIFVLCKRFVKVGEVGV